MAYGTPKVDVIATAIERDHRAKGHGKNFAPLVAAGSWTISGFHYGSSRCGCCGRPIRRILNLMNKSHEAAAARDPAYAFPETIEIGVVCGPKVFIESCVGFYDDPAREWERQHAAWKDYISYVILCVKGKELWDRVPSAVQLAADTFLEAEYKKHDHSGPWWLIRDAKKRYLSIKKPYNDYAMRYGMRSILRCLQRLQLVPAHWILRDDLVLLTEDASLAGQTAA